MDPQKSSRALIYGTEYLEFLSTVGEMDKDWKLTPVLIMEQKMRDLLLDSLGIDSHNRRYDFERTLLLSFKDRKTLLAFVLKFRDSLIEWRRTE